MPLLSCEILNNCPGTYSRKHSIDWLSITVVYERHINFMIYRWTWKKGTLICSGYKAPSGKYTCTLTHHYHCIKTLHSKWNQYIQKTISKIKCSPPYHSVKSLFHKKGEISSKIKEHWILKFVHINLKRWLNKIKV